MNAGSCRGKEKCIAHRLFLAILRITKNSRCRRITTPGQQKYIENGKKKENYNKALPKDDCCCTLSSDPIPVPGLK